VTNVNTGLEEAQPSAAARPWQLPAGARLVIAFEFCERVGFYSMCRCSHCFSLRARHWGFGWKGAPALTFLGAHSGLMYALPVAGGFVAERIHLTLGLGFGYENARITEQGSGTPQTVGSPVYQVPRVTLASNLESGGRLHPRARGLMGIRCPSRPAQHGSLTAVLEEGPSRIR